MNESSSEGGRRQRWSEAFEGARERMRELTSGLSRGQLNCVPATGGWSVGQCIDHLTVSMRVYLDPMEEAVEEARSDGMTGGEPYSRGTWIGRFLVGALRKPGKRYPAPRRFRPREGALDPDEVRKEFEEELERMLRVLDRSRGLALGEVTIPWPAFRLLRVSLAQAFELQSLHLHRHLDQAERVTRGPAFRRQPVGASGVTPPGTVGEQ